MTNADPRQHPRVYGTNGAELCGAEGRFVSTVRDLSLAGCYVETRAKFASRQVEVVFQMPGNRRVSCSAKVVRQDAIDDGTVGMALQFTNVDWDALLGLAKLVAPQLV